MNTKIKKLEETINSIDKKFRDFYENSPDMHVSVNPINAHVKECNKTLVDKIGYTKEEIIGSPIFHLYHPDCMLDVEIAFQQFIKTGRVENVELILKKKDGTRIPVLLDVKAVRDIDGNIIHGNSSWRDITKIKELQNINQLLLDKEKERTDELERKNRELSQFAYIASHDLQEPLRTIISFTDLLEKQYKGQLDINADQYLDFISQASHRMSSLIKGLLDYSRLGHDKKAMQLDCNSIIKDVLNDLNVKISETGTTFDIQKLPQIIGYETELRMLFQNLITNAIKFCKAGVIPKISITAQERKDHWKLSFKDNGIGIADEHKERIFTIFQRLHPKSEYEGTGIGLAHCQKVAELHGGKISIDSQLNIGSTFHVKLKKQIK